MEAIRLFHATWQAQFDEIEAEIEKHKTALRKLELEKKQCTMRYISDVTLAQAKPGDTLKVVRMPE